jgi:Holliday junction resolvase RusA-like endonuclease
MSAKTITLDVIPMGKPRMTQQDKWKKRPCVMRYRAFADEMRRQVGGRIPLDTVDLSWVAYLPIPKSWTEEKKERLSGEFHLQKPDRDNIDKAILDALFKEDSGIATGTITKRWDDGKGPRIELTWGAFE